MMNRLSLSTIFTCTIISFATPALALLFDRPDFFEQGDEQFEQEIERFERQAPNLL